MKTSLLLVAVLALSACSRRVDSLVPAGSPHRNPFAWAADGLLPFPADHYRREGRLQLPAAVWGEPVVANAPTHVERTLARIAARDGFAPNLPIIFAVPGRVASASLPAITASTAPGAAVRLLDTATGGPVAFEAELRALEDTSDGVMTLVFLLPRARLADGATYLVVVRGLKDAAGAAIAPAPVAAANFAGAAPALQATRDAVVRWVPAAERPALQLAYTFTTASNPHRHFEGLRAKVALLADRFPARLKHNGLNRHYFPPLRPGTAWDVFGTFQGWRFVSDEGEIWNTPRRHAVKTMLSLPETCPAGGCPVVIFCHGLQANKETMYQVAGPLNAQGIAVIGVDGMWHESFPQTMHVVNSLTKRYDIFAALIVQHAVLQWQLVELLAGDLRGFDLLPAGAPDGKPDLDVTRIAYIGQSLGGLTGVTVMTHEPRIAAGVFNVAGGGFYQMFTRSILQSALRIPMFEIDGLSPAQGYAATLLATMAIDFVDPLVAAGRLAADPRPKLLQAGLNDGLVPNEASDLLARSLGLRLTRAAPAGRGEGIAVDPAAGLQNGFSYAEWGPGPYAPHLALNGEEQAFEATRFLSAALLRERR